LKKLVTFKDIEKSRKLLGFRKIASIEDIKERYRKLLIKLHPDKFNASPDKKKYEEKVKKINNAYKTIMDYCKKYPISFDISKVKDLEEGEYQKDHLRRFYNDWFGDIEWVYRFFTIIF